MTNILNTRAVLMLAPAFAESDTDPNGNPIVWVNRYSCRSCTSEQIDWASQWSSICDEECPNCGETQSPYESTWMGPKEPPFRRIWELLPEAGDEPPKAEQWTPAQIAAMKDQNMSPAQIVSRVNMIKTAAKVKKLIEEMDSDPDFADIPKRPCPTLQTAACIREMERYEEKEIAWRRMMPAFCNEITQRSAPAWAWDMIDGLLGLGLGDDADLSAVAMKFATENPEYAEITREDAKRAAGVL